MTTRDGPSLLVLAALLPVALLPVACEDGVVVGDGSGSRSDGGSNGGTPFEPAPQLIEPDGEGPTGTLPPATGVASLDPEDVAAARFLTSSAESRSPCMSDALNRDRRRLLQRLAVLPFAGTGVSMMAGNGRAHAAGCGGTGTDARSLVCIRD